MPLSTGNGKRNLTDSSFIGACAIRIRRRLDTGDHLMRRLLLAFISAVFFALFATTSAVLAASCPSHPHALGTSRVLTVDPAAHPRIGSIQYRETLALRDHEVVLTFDDGPASPNTPRVLDALKAECVQATFFVIGALAKRSPALMRRLHDEGHSIGTHSLNHPVNMPHIPQTAAEKEIADGIAAARAALGPGRHLAPFFRFPALNRTVALENYAAGQGLMMWSADHYADDWMKISPEEVAARPLRRLERAGRGVVLFHDIQGRTAAALPAFLRGLKERGFRIVHVVAVSGATPQLVSAPADWRALDKRLLDLPPHMKALPQY